MGFDYNIQPSSGCPCGTLVTAQSLWLIFSIFTRARLMLYMCTLFTFQPRASHPNQESPYLECLGSIALDRPQSRGNYDT